MSRLFLCAALFVVALAPGVLRAQVREGSPDDFAPEINGPVHDLLVEDDGRIVIVGEFTVVNGERRNRIARLDSGGELDPEFASGEGADGTVRCIVEVTRRRGPGPLGTFYFIAGDFAVVDGVPRAKVAALQSDGALWADFDAGSGPEGEIRALAMDPEGGTLHVGGDFTGFGGVNVRHLVSLNLDGNILAERVPSSQGGPVNCLEQTDQYLVVGGAIRPAVGSSRGQLALFDRYRNYERASLEFEINGPVELCRLVETRSFAPDLILTGEFTQIDDESRPGFARISLRNGELASERASFSGGSVRAIHPLQEGLSDRYVAAGDFEAVLGVPWPSYARFRLENTSFGAPGLAGLELEYEPGTGANATIRAMGSTPDGRLYLGGDFTTLDGKPRSYLARLYGPWLDRMPDPPLDLFASPVSESSIALYWEFSSRREGYLVQRLDADGERWETVGNPGRLQWILDTDLAPGATYSYRVLATNFNGEGPPSPVASATTLAQAWSGPGRIDRPFTSQMDGMGAFGQNCAVELPDGRILIGGGFTTFQDQPRQRLAMIFPDGSLDPAFDPGDGPDREVDVLEWLPNGQFLVGGDFKKIGEVEMPHLCRLNSDGSLDTTFQSPFRSSDFANIYDILPLPDGRILIGGSFNGIGERPEEEDIALLHSDGSIDLSFSTGGDVFGTVEKLAWLPDGTVLVLGPFRYRNQSVDDPFVIETDGSLVGTLLVPLPSSRTITNWQFDHRGNLYLVGDFDYGPENAYRNIARLRPGGTLDPTFVPPEFYRFSSHRIQEIALTRENKIVIMGQFPVVDGQVVPGIARLNADGSLDENFLLPEIYAERFQDSSWSVPEQVFVSQHNELFMVGAREFRGEISPAGLLRLRPDEFGDLSPPEDLTATATSSQSITIEWTYPELAWSVLIERSRDGISGWEAVGEFVNPAATVEEVGLAAGERWHYRATFRAGALESLPSASAAATTLTGFEQWLADAGHPIGSDPLATGGSSGTSFLMAYALGLPAARNMAETTAIRIYPAFGRLFLVYPRVRDGLRYEVERSANLTDWTAEGVDQGPPGPAGVASIALDSDAPGYLRLTAREW